MEWGLSGRVGSGSNFYGGLAEAVGEMIPSFACWRWLMGGGEKTTFCFEDYLLCGAHLFEEACSGGFEVTEAGVGLFVDEFDARGERHVGLVEVDLLIGDFDHLVFGHAGGEDRAELLVIEEREGSA